MKVILSILFFFTSLLCLAQKKNIKTEKFTIQGNCEHCKERIETTLKKAGVYKAKWISATKILTVSFDSTKFSKGALQQKLADVGHGSDGFLIKKAVYDELPECCQYDCNIFYEGQKIQEKKNTDSLKKIEIEKEPSVSTSEKKNTPISKTTTPERQKLDSVIVNTKNFGTNISAKVVTNTLNITQKELKKAACCNLSESFETSPSVDVSYTDAVTGIKQIQLLGLSGNYTQITTENVAELRGLAGSFGLTFIPGPWVEGIQVTKGTGSVANGFESIAGQINIEEIKPLGGEKLFLNSYINNFGRLETSLNLKHEVSKKVSTALLLHANALVSKNDFNGDGFLDMPLGNQTNVINRWYYESEKGLEIQLIGKYLKDKRIAGALNFDESKDKLTTNNYGVGININQYALTGKIGYLFKNKPYQSIGLMLHYNDYNNESYYGLREYMGHQNSFYANLIFQSIIGNTNHKYRTGLSFINDDFHEKFDINHYKRKEIIPGAFVEYTFTPNEKFTAIIGLRADNHNYFNWFATSRLNVKYSFSKNTTARFSAGNGTRMANIFAENTGFFVSSRNVILSPTNNFGFGFEQEKAWNFGLNILHKFKINNHQGNISFDIYRTDFVQQTVVDVDKNAQEINFYNLQGNSFSNSFQIEINYEILPKFDVRLAYRYLDVQTNYSGNLLQKPLVAQHRAFINLAYETKSKWIFDITTQLIGNKRMPGTHHNPADKQMPVNSPSFEQINAQITKQFNKKWDVYIGAENLTNFIQQEAIIDHKNPFGKYFDASMIWGPINGRVIYIGMRFKLI